MDKVQHFEIPADDVARARKFYEGVFGWRTSEFPISEMMYVGLHTGPVDDNNNWQEPGFINGGMFQRNADIPVQGPTVAITVPDIEAALEKVKASGGAVVTPTTQIGQMGLYAYIKDSEGNVIGVWQCLAPAP